MEDCLEKAEELCEQEKFVPALSWYLLSTSPELALDIGLNLARGDFADTFFKTS